MRPFAYTLPRRHRRYALGAVSYLTVGGRNSRIVARQTYRQLRRSVSAAHARDAVVLLLTAGQCTIYTNPLGDVVARSGTHEPRWWQDRAEVAA